MTDKAMPGLMVNMLNSMEQHEAECMKDAQRARSQGYSFHADELVCVAKLSENRREYYKELWEIENK